MRPPPPPSPAPTLPAVPADASIIPAVLPAALPDASAVDDAAPCAVWSHHAAELAAPLAEAMLRFEETPPTRVLVAEGKVMRLLPGMFLPPDLLGTAVQRALALGCALGGRLRALHVIAGLSAAWVVLGGQPPQPLELLTPAHRPGPAGVRLRTGVLRSRDVETLGGAPVTVPGRTATDLLRFAPPYLAEPVVRRLVASGHVGPDQVDRRLWEMRRHPGVRAARQRFELLLEPAQGTVPPAVSQVVPSRVPPLRRRRQALVRGAPAPTGFPSAVTR